MFDRDWKTWSLIAIFAVGVLFEVIKHMPDGDSDLWKPESFRISNALPYSVHELHDQTQLRTKPKAPRLLGNPISGSLKEAMAQFVAANTPTSTEFDKKDVKDPKAADKKKKKDEEWEEYIDPVTGKKMRRKKKKDDKDKKEEVAATTPPAPTPATPTTADIAPADVPPTIGSVANPPDDPIYPNTSPTGPEAAQSLQQWEARLLASPNSSETMQFIQLYKENQVSKQVFYGVVESMLADSRPGMKSLGLLCLTDTPSAASFELLASFDKSEPAGNTLRTQADADLNQYASIADLGVLQTVLDGGDSYSQTVAAQKLDTAAQAYLRNGITPPTGQPGQQSANNASQFTPFIPILQALTRSSNSTLSAQATTTLKDLQSLLGNGSSNTAIASTVQSQ